MDISSDNCGPQIKANPRLPDGRYVARYLREFRANVCLGLEFEITQGERRRQVAHMPLRGRKVEQAFEERSGMWLDWIAYEGDTVAGKVSEAILNCVQGQFFIFVKDGFVKRVVNVKSSESMLESILKALSIE